MEGKFNYEPRRKYPHLLGLDHEIWDRFIKLYPDLFNTVDYDIHVGSGIPAEPGSDSDKKRQWQNLTQKRIDVVGFKDGFPHIVEVKDRVGLATLGQVLGYKFLYMREYPELDSIPLLVVTADCGPDDKDVLKNYNVNIFVV